MTDYVRWEQFSDVELEGIRESYIRIQKRYPNSHDNGPISTYLREIRAVKNKRQRQARLAAQLADKDEIKL